MKINEDLVIGIPDPQATAWKQTHGKKLLNRQPWCSALKKTPNIHSRLERCWLCLFLRRGPFKTSASFGSGGHPLGYRTKQCVQEIFIYLANGTSNLRRYTSHKYIKLTHFSSNLHGFTIYVVNNNWNVFQTKTRLVNLFWPLNQKRFRGHVYPEGELM